MCKDIREYTYKVLRALCLIVDAVRFARYFFKLLSLHLAVIVKTDRIHGYFSVIEGHQGSIHLIVGLVQSSSSLWQSRITIRKKYDDLLPVVILILLRGKYILRLSQSESYIGEAVKVIFYRGHFCFCSLKSLLVADVNDITLVYYLMGIYYIAYAAGFVKQVNKKPVCVYSDLLRVGFRH